MPRRVVAVLKGESLLNDASALLLFAAAVASVHEHDASNAAFALRIAVAVPGGVLLGILWAGAVRPLRRALRRRHARRQPARVRRLPSAVWIIAERLELSAVLCLVAFAMTLARNAGLNTRARTRIHSFAVWDTAVFLLNVLAFLLMGLQARSIVGGMPAERLREAGRFALAVILCLVVVRMAWVLAYSRLARPLRPAGRSADPGARRC